jgi:ABC-type phosphate transport system substrate-binding protein
MADAEADQGSASHMRRLRKCVLLAIAVALASFGQVWPATAAPARAVAYAAISGSGSTWAAVGLNQWAEDIRADGLVVNFNPDGSVAGLADYRAGVDDFAASDVPFLRYRPGRKVPTSVRYGYSYVPDVAGGVALAYHISVHGHLITNLRLSAKTIMEIFTGGITNWDNSQVTREYGHQLPSLPITPVVHSEVSGVTLVLTNWMAQQFPHQWNAFCARVLRGVRLPCGPVEVYPRLAGFDAQNGSANVIKAVMSHATNGTIGYDEYAYALNDHAPVVRVRNPAGRYVLPTAGHVATALRQAAVTENPASPNFGLQQLRRVFADKDPRSYPLSYYSYLIVPRAGTRLPPGFTKAAGRSLSVYIDFLLCQGQRQAAELGYAPLPANLVKAGRNRVAEIPGHVAHAPRFARCR